MNSPIAEQMTDNEALRHIVSELRDQNNFLLGRYDEVEDSGNITISPITTTVRAARPKALKTIITNFSADKIARIMEDNALIGVVGPLQTWVSPLTGKGVLKMELDGSFSSATVVVATYLAE